MIRITVCHYIILFRYYYCALRRLLGCNNIKFRVKVFIVNFDILSLITFTVNAQEIYDKHGEEQPSDGNSTDEDDNITLANLGKLSGDYIN